VVGNQDIQKGLEATKEIKVDVRFLASTRSRNLIEKIKARPLRDDLYYRLGVISVTIPAA